MKGKNKKMLNLKINKEFDRIIKEATESRLLKEYLEEVDRYGQDEFVYYSETTELYDQYKSDCEEWLDDEVSESGLKPWEIFPNWDYAIDSDDDKFIVIVAMFEEYCNYLLEGLDQ